MVPFAIDPDIARASTLPSAWYRDPSTYTTVIEKVFVPSWQFLIADQQLQSERGIQAVPLELLPGSVNEPVIAIREGSETRVLSNVCTHRGNILIRQACSLREIKCMYHGRRFKTDGSLVQMPEFKEVEGFPSASDNLANLYHGEWANMHFAQISTVPRGAYLNADRSPHVGGPLPVNFESWSRRMHERLSFLPLEKAEHRASFDRDFEVKAHWALYVENYLEGFHIPFVHPGLNAQLEWNSYETLCEDYGVLQIGIAREGDVVFDLPANHIDLGKNVAAYYYWMFPNTMINVYPWGISLNVVLPQAIDRTIIRYRTFVWDDAKFNTGAGSSLDVVEQEDDDVVEHQQLGMQSRIYDRGRYSVKRERGVHHFHRMLEAVLTHNDG